MNSEWGPHLQFVKVLSQRDVIQKEQQVSQVLFEWESMKSDDAI